MDIPVPTSSIEGLQPPRFRLDGIQLDTVIEPVRVRYERRVIELWDTSIPVYVLVGWPQERIEATLAKVLLSDLAHSLAEKA